jgi:MerR family mercuric resistance operon transcriptional regulator
MAKETLPDETFSIGRLSRLTGVNIETVRYYERIEMLPAPPRTEGGRRVYGSSQARTLSFIRRARELGFTLAEVRTLLDLADTSQRSCADVAVVASAHLAAVRLKLTDLARLEGILAGTLAKCAGDLSPECPVIDMLDGASADWPV